MAYLWLNKVPSSSIVSLCSHSNRVVKQFLVHFRQLAEIAAHVSPGSMIYSDMWKGYVNMEEIIGFRHMTVNHSLNFKDPITQVHTNNIEAFWSAFILSRSAEKCKKPRSWSGIK
jgi:dimeric dUTPase (all-alpha-NTP-PPase superfamily)